MTFSRSRRAVRFALAACLTGSVLVVDAVTPGVLPGTDASPIASALDPSTCANASTLDWGSLGDGADPSSVVVGGMVFDLTRDDQVASSLGRPDFEVDDGRSGRDNGYYRLSMDASGFGSTTSTDNYETLIITPRAPVSGLSFDVLDVDKSVDFRDGVLVSGFLNGTPVVPTLTLKPTMVQDGSNPQAVLGNSASGIPSSSSDGNLGVLFDSPIDRVEIRYYAAPVAGITNPDRQTIGIGDISTCQANLGLSKAASPVVDNQTYYSTTFTFEITNYGGVPAYDIALFDAIAGGPFGDYFPPPILGGFEYTIADVRTIQNSADPVDVNPLFNGDNEAFVIIGGGSIAPDETVIVEVDVDFIPDLLPFNATNQAFVYGDDFTRANNDPEFQNFDTSHNGDDPDPNGDGNPIEADPTPISLTGEVASTPRCADEARFEWSAFADGDSPTTITSTSGVVATLTPNQNGIDPGTILPGSMVVSATQTQGGQNGFYQMAMDADDVDDFVELTVSFSEPVGGVEFTMLDVDFGAPLNGGDGWRDIVVISGSLNGVPVTPAGVPTGPRVGAFNTGNPNEAGFAGIGPEGAPNGTTAGNARFGFPGVIDFFTIRYTAGDPGDQDPGEQVIGIGPFTWCNPSIGAAKQLDTLVHNGDGTYAATYVYSIENDGGSPLTDIDVTEDLAARFGTYVAGTPANPGEYTIDATTDLTIGTNSADAVTASSTFTGSGANQQLLDLAADGSLAVDEIIEVTAVVTFVPTFTSMMFAVDNNVTATGDVAANDNGVADADVSDVSTNGTIPDPDGDGKPTEDDPTPLKVVIDPRLDVDKIVTGYFDADGDGQLSVGDFLNFAFQVDNVGNVRLDAPTIDDPLVPNATCPPGSIDPGGFLICNGSYEILPGDADLGKFDNTATASATPPFGPPVDSPPSSTLTPIPESASIDLVKTVSAGPYAVNDVITYTFVITNTGDSTLNSVAIADTKLGLSNFTCGITTLGGAGSVTPPDTTTCTAPYTVTQPDVDAGVIDNTATVTATSPRGTNVNDNGTAKVIIDQEPKLTLDKSASSPIAPATDFFEGDTITYTFTVTNTGDVTLDPVEVDDPTLSVTDLDCGGPLAPSNGAVPAPAASIGTCMATQVVSATDVLAGQIVNTATATGTSPIGVDVNDTDDEVVDVAAEPKIEVVKSLTTVGPYAASQVLTYDFTVTNSGNVPLSAVSIADDRADNESCVDSTLAVGASTTCTATYTVQQTDINAGSWTNNVVASGQPPTPPSGTVPPPVTGIDDHTASQAANPDISITKTAASGDFDEGDTITYTFVITNTGNVTLTDVTYEDARISVAAGTVCGTPGPITLDPGDTTTCTADYVVLQSDVNDGEIDNTASTTGTPPAGTPPVGTGNAVVNLTQKPSLDTVKRITSNTANLAVNDTVDYEFVVTNDGNVTLDDVTLTDTLTGVSAPDCLPTVLPLDGFDPGDSFTCTASYTVTQPNIDAGRIDNIATASGTPPNGLPPVDDPGDSSLILPQNPGISTTKTLDSRNDVDTSNNDTEDDILTYEFVITNTGNVTLTNVGITDTLLNLTNAQCGATTTLAPNTSTSCTFPYTLTQADVDAGERLNTATGSGTPPAGLPPVTDTPTLRVELPADPKLTLDKQLTAPAGPIAADDILTYTFDLVNTGNVVLDPIAVTDDKVGTVNCPVTSLAPGAATQCSALYTVLQSDVDAGQIVNNATGSGTPPGGGNVPVPPTDTVTTPLPQSPSFDFVKTAATVPSPLIVGSLIEFDFTFTNTGNVTLTNLAVDDPKISNADCGTGGPVAPGDPFTCTGSYAVQQPDIDAGTFVNTATGTADPPAGLAPLPPKTSSVTTPIPQNPDWTFTKSRTATPTGPDFAEGDTLTYEFTFTNTGNTTITGISVTDAKVGAVTCPVTSLGAGLSTTCTATYDVTQADIDAGQIVNVATPNGNPPLGAPPLPVIPEPPRTVTTPITKTPALTLDKTFGSATDPDGSGGLSADDVITFEFEVENTGNVTLDPITVTDAKLGFTSAAPLACSGALLPGATTTCTGDYTVSQADVDAGTVDNTATATGTPPGLPPVDSPPSSVSTPIDSVPSLALTKSLTSSTGDIGAIAVDDELTYTLTVTNDGQATIDDVTVTDTLIPGPFTCTRTAPDSGTFTLGTDALAPGQGADCVTGAYTVTQADVDAGQIVNTGGANGNPPTGVLPNPPDVTITTPIPQTTVLDLTKTATVDQTVVGDPDVTDVDDEIDYVLVATNNGTVTISDVTVSDPTVGALTCVRTAPQSGPFVLGTDDLAPGEAIECTGTVTLTQDEINAGKADNTATAGGTPPVGAPPVVPPTPTVSTPIDRVSAIQLDKSASLPAGAGLGDDITYTIEITNTGNVTLDPVTFDDPLLNQTAATCNGITSLDPGDSTTCVFTYELDQPAIDAGKVDNTATATGTPPSGPPPTDSGSTSTLLQQNPSIDLVKSVTGTVTAGTDLDYTFVVTNDGDVTLTGVDLIDDLAGIDPLVCDGGAVTLGTATLAPGASFTCTASYEVTVTDANANTVVNDATASGTPPPGGTVEAKDSKPVNGTNTPAIDLAKTVVDDNGGDVEAGDQLTFTLLAENTGSQTLTAVEITDNTLPGLSALTCVDPDNANAPVTTPTTLDPGERISCEATYTVDQDDIDAGEIANTGEVTGTPPGGAPPVIDTSDTLLNPPQNPQIELVKTQTGNSDPDGSGTFTADDVITYTFVVTNTGDVTLTDVSLTDGLTGQTAVDCNNASGELEPNESTTCTGTYTLDQNDVDAGSLTNTASVTGTPPSGPPVDDVGSVTINPPRDSELELVKSLATDVSAGITDGQVLTYEFLVTNNGSVRLTDVGVIDNKVGTVTCPGAPVTLEPGGSVTCEATYTVDQNDIDAGVIINDATANGTPPVGATPPTPPTSRVTTPIDRTPSFDFVKTAATVPAPLTEGSTIDYEFTFTNTGNVRLDGIAVTDPQIPTVDCGAGGPLDPGDDFVCTGSYTLSQDDVDAGTFVNTATGTANPPAGVPAPPPGISTETVPVPRTPNWTFTKTRTAAPAGPNFAVNDVLTYEFTFTNTGNTTITGISVDDPKVGTVACPANELDPGDTLTCTATYAVTQDDINAGEIVNVATPAGTPPAGAPPLPTIPAPPRTVTTRIDVTPGIDLTKSFASATDPDGSGTISAGDMITYDFRITNSGNVTLDPIEIVDTKLGFTPVAPLGCGGPLLPGATLTCSSTYTVQQSDIDAGTGIDNTATAQGTPPSGGTPESSPPSSVNVPTPNDASLDIAKSLTNNADGDASGTISVDDLLTYTLSVTNDGSVSVDDVTVADTLIPGPFTCVRTAPDSGAFTLGADALAPGQGIDCTTGTYLVVQADVDAGQITNTGSTDGTPPGGGTLPNPPDVTIVTPVPQTTQLSATKTSTVDQAEVAPNDRTDVNDEIDYVITTVNTGTVTIDAVTVTDLDVPTLTCTRAAPDTGAFTLGTDALAPGQGIECLGTALVTQADTNAGQATNTATAGGTPPVGAPPLVVPPVTRVTPIDRVTSIEIVKSASAPTGLTNGDDITFTFTITNTGTVTLTDVTYDDDLLGLVGATCGGVSTLDAGASTTCTGTYTVDGPDVAAGQVDNNATTTGTPPPGAGDPPTDISSTSTQVAQSPQIQVTKSLASNADGDNSNTLTAGDVLTYEFLIQNTGDVPLTGVTLDDPTIGNANIDCGTFNGNLAVGGDTTCTGTYTLDQVTDVDTGAFENTASVSGIPPTGNPPVTDTGQVTVNPPRVPELTLVKTLATNNDEDASGSVTVDDTLDYEFLVTNTGTVTMDDVSVTDPKVGTVTCPGAPVSLAPTEAVTCTATYTVDQADVNQGNADNMATASGTPPTGLPPYMSPPSTQAVPIQRTPLIEVVKTNDASASPQLNDVITYTFTVTNRGNVDLTGLTFVDQLVGIVPGTCAATDLAPGASTTCTATYEVTQPDVDAGLIDNSVEVTANPPTGLPPVDDVDDNRVVIPPAPALVLSKVTDADAATRAGDTITYTFVAVNTGNVSLDDVTITDPLPGLSALTCTPTQPTTLLPTTPGNELRCTADYVVPQTAVDAGEIVNEATAVGTPPGGTTLRTPRKITTPLTQTASMTLLKSPSSPTGVEGETITYTFAVTNTGLVTISGVTITDPLPNLGPISCDTRTIAPTEVATCTADYTLTQDDVDAGGVTNTATATGSTPPGAPPVPPVTSTTPVTTPQSPSLTIFKELIGTAPTNPAEGDTVGYRFTVTNNGTVTLTSIAVVDTKVPGATCPVTTLAPTESTICTGTYDLSQVDIDAGEVVNSATATGIPPAGAPPLPTVPPSVVTTDLPQAPGLTLTKVRNPVPASPALGDTLTYDFVATNTGNVTLTGVEITDPLPGLSALSCTQPATLAPGGELRCSATYLVEQNDIDRGIVSNTATVTGTPPVGAPPLVPVQPPTVDTPLTQAPALAIAKSFDDLVNNGDGTFDITFTVTATNTGDVTQSDLVITDDIIGQFPGVSPSGFVATNGTLTASATWDGTATSNVITAGQSLAPGAVGTVVIGVTVLPGTAESTTNVASVAGTPPGAGAPPTTSTSDPVVVPFSVEPDVDTFKSVVSGPTNQQDGSFTITYRVEVENTGNVVVRSLQITDDLAAAFAPITDIDVTAIRSDDLTVNTSYDGVGDTDLLTGADEIRIGERFAVDFDVVVRPGAAVGTYSNTATATGIPPGVPPFAQPSPPASVELDYDFDLQLVKTVASQSGARATFSLAVGNNGPDAAPGPIVVRDPLPSGLAFVSASGPSGWTCVNSGQDVTCTLPGSFAAGDTATISIVADVTATTSVSNTATVESVFGLGGTANGEADVSNNGDSASVSPPATQPPPDNPIPATGSDSAPLVRLAWIALLAGVVLFLLGRRRIAKQSA